jgi:DNA-binding XRE family transcriptional regulator
VDHLSSFAKALKQRRKACDLTQQELAQHVGCATVTIQRLEQGTLRPSRQIVQR